MNQPLKLTLAQKMKYDLPASLAVFLVAIPLCLGIALACQAPLMSGLIAGIVGGIFIGLISDSPLSVSGPAAGLTAIILASIQELGSFEAVCAATAIAGMLQILFAFLKFGKITRFLPHSVIEGMMCAIGLILIVKQTPVFIGVDQVHSFHIEALFIGIISIVTMVIWEKFYAKKFLFIPSSLIVVVLSLIIASIFHHFFTEIEFSQNYFVQLPLIQNAGEFLSHLPSPDWSQFQNFIFYKVTFTIALVASIESLLSINAIERMAKHETETNKNRELFAQGIGNLISGFLGGLPMTSVIVRSSVNFSAGAKSKLSTIFHGLWLLIALLFAAKYINHIPLVALASILIYTGFKLAHPKNFIIFYKQGKIEFISYVSTVAVILIKDLLIGVLFGLVIHRLLSLYMQKKLKA
jgi:MFS superfamily sulfate permease-like transporter